MCANRPTGFSLIEVVVFIVVLGAGFAGMLTLYNQVTTASVDPVIRKQALALATSLLEEIQLRGFTYCDPDDQNAASSATAGTADCFDPNLVEVVPNPPGTVNEQAESRYVDPRFDNVNDYHGFTMSGSDTSNPLSIRDITNTVIPGLDGYSVAVAIVNIAAGELGADVSSTADALRITVNVTAPAGVNVRLQGYKLRYAPTTP